MWGNLEKYGRARQVAGDNIMRDRKDAVCMSDNCGKNTDAQP